MRQIKRIAVSLVLALGALLQLHAQNRAVGGTVLDASGQPVIGAVVMVGTLPWKCRAWATRDKPFRSPPLRLRYRLPSRRIP